MEASQETFGSVEIVDSMETVEFDADRKRFRAMYDCTCDSESMAVVAVVATALNRDPLDLTPLYSSIESGAREELFSESPLYTRDYGCISFCYEGFEVSVFSEGVIEAVPVENT